MKTFCISLLISLAKKQLLSGYRVQDYSSTLHAILFLQIYFCLLTATQGCMPMSHLFKHLIL